MTFICPNDKSHEHFYTGAVVSQVWKVDGTGEFIEVSEECAAVYHRPNSENEWECAECGAVAVEK